MKQKGFTLLEILLVIAAIGILAAIVIVAINPQRQLAQVRDAERESSVNTITNALNQYLIDEGGYPTAVSATEQEVCADGVAEATCTSEGLLYLGDLTPDYIAAIPREPQSTGNGAGYRVSTDSSGSRVFVKASQKEVVSCPEGYIPVPGNALYGTEDFCVMKYEAKVDDDADGVGDTTQYTESKTWPNNTHPVGSDGRVLVSSAAGYPLAQISQTDSITACQAVGGGLLTLAQRQTIARNIEGVATNWTGGVVWTEEEQSGQLYQGHTDDDPGNALAASTDDADGYSGTGNTASSSSEQRRTYTLSNGEVIWDMSGNVWEWLDDTIQGQDKPNNGSSGTTWQEWTDFSDGQYGSLSYDLVRPSNSTWNSTQGVGRYYAGTVTGTTSFAVLSGGDWNSDTAAGLITLLLHIEPSSTHTDFGFRCSLSPGV